MKWISCSKRLPEINDWYLVYAPYYSGGSSTAKENHKGVMFSSFKNGRWGIESRPQNRQCVKEWMPIPVPHTMHPILSCNDMDGFEEMLPQ